MQETNLHPSLSCLTILTMTIESRNKTIMSREQGECIHLEQHLTFQLTVGAKKKFQIKFGNFLEISWNIVSLQEILKLARNNETSYVQVTVWTKTVL